MTTINRETRETRVRVTISRDVAATAVDTSVPFLDHMLATLARYAGLGIAVEASGDLRHHVIEDVAISLGRAVKEFAPTNVARYGERTIPMDDALVHCALDIGGRPYYCGRLPSPMYEHWMRSFADNAGATLHLRVLRGRDRHHIVEAGFKALGVSLRDALRESDGVFSTKGDVRVTASA